MDNIPSLIFLDIDGVINNKKNEQEHIKQKKSISSYKITLPTQQIVNLKQILDSVPNPRIILSSSWRLGGPDGLDMRNLGKQLSSFGIYIDDTTPYLGHQNSYRGLEIMCYLETFNKIEGYFPPYIILDDNIKSIIPYHKGHIVYCNPIYGLDGKGVNISINLIKKQRNEFLRSSIPVPNQV